MKIYLTAEDIRMCRHSGYIELSDAAILQAYELQNLRYAAQDIAEHIAPPDRGYRQNGLLCGRLAYEGRGGESIHTDQGCNGE